MNENKKEAAPRKPYQKPTATRFSLRPEEAVLGTCKSTTSQGPSSSSNNCTPFGFCQTAGS